MQVIFTFMYSKGERNTTRCPERTFLPLRGTIHTLTSTTNAAV